MIAISGLSFASSSRKSLKDPGRNPGQIIHLILCLLENAPIHIA